MSDPAVPSGDDEPLEVLLIRWPDDSAARSRARAAGIPRLLLLQPGVVPPSADPLEDWVRVPAEPEELELRVAALRQRASRQATPRRPSLDEDGLLRSGLAWVALSPLESRLIAPMLERSGSVVRRDELKRSVWPDGEPDDPRALDVRVKKLRRRIEPLGLRIHTVAGRGFLLELPP